MCVCCCSLSVLFLLLFALLFFVFATQLICKTSAGNISCHPLSWAQFLPALRSRSLSPLSLSWANQTISAPSHSLTRTHTEADRRTQESEGERAGERERRQKWLHYKFQFCFIIIFTLPLFLSLFVCVLRFCFVFVCNFIFIIIIILRRFLRIACRRKRGSKAKAQMKTKLQNAAIICSQGKSCKE